MTAQNQKRVPRLLGPNWQGVAAARALRSRLDQALAKGLDISADPALMGEISRFSIGTVCDKRELFWPRRVFNFKAAEITRILGRYFSGRSRATLA